MRTLLGMMRTLLGISVTAFIVVTVWSNLPIHERGCHVDAVCVASTWQLFRN
jgi:hypothetical protein